MTPFVCQWPFFASVNCPIPYQIMLSGSSPNASTIFRRAQNFCLHLGAALWRITPQTWVIEPLFYYLDVKDDGKHSYNTYTISPQYQLTPTTKTHTITKKMSHLAWNDNEKVLAHIYSNKHWHLKNFKRKKKEPLCVWDNSCTKTPSTSAVKTTNDAAYADGTLWNHRRRDRATKNEVTFQRLKSRFKSCLTFGVFYMPSLMIQLTPAVTFIPPLLWALIACATLISFWDTFLIGWWSASLFSLHSRSRDNCWLAEENRTPHQVA